MSEFVTKVVVKGENQTGPALAAATKGVQNYSKAVQQGNAALRATTRQSRATFTQLGYQAQDVAVQLQAGQSPFMVLSQQGSQIASIFGPGGAVFGAFLAIGGAIAGSLVPNLFKGAETMETLNEKAKDLGYTLEQLMPLTAKFDEIKNKIMGEKAQDKASDALAEQVALVTDLYDRIDFLNSRQDATNTSTQAAAALQKKLNIELRTLETLAIKAGEASGTFAERIARAKAAAEAADRPFETLNDQLTELNELYVQFESPAERLVRLYKQADEVVRKYAGSEDLANKMRMAALEQYKATLPKKKEAVDLTDKEAKAYETLKRSLDPTYSATQAYYDAVTKINASSATQEEKIRYIAIAYAKYYEALNPVNEKLKESHKTVKSANNVFQDYADTIKDTTSLIDGAGMNALRSMEDQFSSLIAGTVSVKDAFSNMALSIVNDLIKIQIQKSITGPLANMMAGASYEASSNFVGPPSPGGTGVFDFFKNLWPFEGGGYTGSGSRSGGLDGKGGFPAILHPNETVVDHTQGDSGSGVTIVQNINIQTGVQQTVRAEIKNLLPQITAATKSAVADSRQRGGGFSKALVGA